MTTTTILIIFYLIGGVVTSALYCTRRFDEYWSKITLEDVLDFLISFVMSWVLIAIVAFIYFAEYFKDVVIYERKNDRNKQGQKK